MITTIILVSLSLAWLLFETDFLRIRLPIGAIKPINKESPYWWQPVKNNMIMCLGCRTKCHKDKERWTGWKIPARTVKAFNSTMHFEDGCNILRASILKDVVRAQNTKTLPKLTGAQIYHRDNNESYYGCDEPTIDILVDGELKASINGNYKRGMITDTLKPYTTKTRIGRKSVNLAVGEADRV
jgi:hypothetical protein